MNAPLPTNEKRRLEVLWQCDILDTAPEESFDDITELAALVCETPVALISLVDDVRQWFKARIGFEPTETPREVSFCAHAILKPDVMVVPDATKDPRFARNPLVVGESHVRFYAGSPLITPEGHALGTLCVIDRQPRQLSEKQIDALRRLARLTMLQLEHRRQIRKLSGVPIRQRDSGVLRG